MVAAATATGALDVVIVGGGLAGGLTALAYARRQPGLRVGLVEPAATLGGPHLWSFHHDPLAGYLVRTCP